VYTVALERWEKIHSRFKQEVVIGFLKACAFVVYVEEMFVNGDI